MANFLKSKIFLSVLFLGLAAFIVGGITMAWFTSDADLEAAEFKAGTVEIMVSEENEDGDSYPIIKMPEMNLNSVNPGDCATVIWEFVNEGTKDVQLKVKLTEEWSKSKLKVKHVYLCPIDPVDGKGWVMGEGHEDDNEGEIWLYYVDWSGNELGSVPGTVNAEDPEDRTVQLKVVVVFDKEKINNDYQGETYTLGGEGSAVYAIQASNQAPETQWEDWTTVSQKGYEPDTGVAGENYDYFHNPCKRGSDTECWLRANGEEPQDPNKCKVTIKYKDSKGYNVRNQEYEYFYPGDWATITAPEITGYKFKEWSVPGWLDEEFTNGGKTIGFEMPDRNDLVITAKYETAKNNVTVYYKNESGDSIKNPIYESKNVGSDVSYTAPEFIEKSGKKYAFDKWIVVSGLGAGDVDIDGREIEFDMPDNDVVLTAKYVRAYYLKIEKQEVGNKSNGTVSGEGWYGAGKQVTVQANPKSGYKFTEWTQKGGSQYQSSDNPYTFTMPSYNLTLKAHFNWD